VAVLIASFCAAGSVASAITTTGEDIYNRLETATADSAGVVVATSSSDLLGVRTFVVGVDGSSFANTATVNPPPTRASPTIPVTTVRRLSLGVRLTPVTLLTALASASGVPDSGLAGFVADTMNSMGLLGVGLILAVETILPFLPSEVALPLAGFTASVPGNFSVVGAIVAATVGSVGGAMILYWLSREFGLDRTRSLLSKVPLVTARDIDKGVAWFARNDGAAVFFGRMVPAIRSLISIPAGVEKMAISRFLIYTTAGSLLWNTIWIVAGYQLGSHWTRVEKYGNLLKYGLAVAVLAAIAWFVAYKLRSRPAA
jgi:membrane protein DedA with SNARE-associated domain